MTAERRAVKHASPHAISIFLYSREQKAKITDCKGGVSDSRTDIIGTLRQAE